MPKSKDVVRVAAVGDIHVNEASSGMCRELLASMRDNADVLVICGDMTNRGLPKEAEVLADELASVRIPVIGVLGNHDFESNRQQEVMDVLCRAGVQMLEAGPCEVHGIGFAGVKGFCGGFETHMLAPWGEQSIKAFVHETVEEALSLESSLAQLRTEHKIAVLHYAPIRGTVEGEPPEIFAFLGSSRLAEPIDRYNASVAFHGHAHRGAHQGQTVKGIPVYNVALPLMRQVNPDRPYMVCEF